jgi:hypothetical protein
LGVLGFKWYEFSTRLCSVMLWSSSHRSMEFQIPEEQKFVLCFSVNMMDGPACRLVSHSSWQPKVQVARREWGGTIDYIYIYIATRDDGFFFCGTVSANVMEICWWNLEMFVAT